MKYGKNYILTKKDLNKWKQKRKNVFNDVTLVKKLK
jgi:hypothetical protein